MSRPSVAFPRSYQRHLVTEQRKAVLAAIRDRIGPEHTVGEVLDAAEALGWGESMGELSLSDLAAALLAPIGAGAEESDTDDGDADDDELEDEAPEVDDEPEAPAKRTAGKVTAKAKKGATKAKKVPSKAPSSPPAKASAAKKKSASKKAAKASGAAAKKAASKTASKTTTKAASKKTAKTAGKKTGKGRRAAKVDFDEPMSLDEAAGVLVPLVKGLGEATMQDLEEQTAGGRRKLRFHIGQLVRHGYLVRHGMGRGTFYTVG